jgi:hypothetical protein
VTPHTPFVDLALARRLERAEANGGVSFIDARMHLQPERGATWMHRHGAFAMFDGPGSPVTQTFGLGLEHEATAADLDALEAFFFDREADADHEVSPLAGVHTFALLAARGYTPIELTSVMFQPIANTRTPPGGAVDAGIHVRRASVDDAELFGVTAARGWSELPEVGPFLRDFGRVIASRAGGHCFLAEINGEPVATGALVISDGVALLAGASTVPECRRRGAQLALLEARLRAAADAACDLAMMCAAPGSASQRNAERNGFRIAYTRVKWQRKRLLQSQ